MGANIRTCQEIQCLPYAGFFYSGHNKKLCVKSVPYSLKFGVQIAIFFNHYDHGPKFAQMHWLKVGIVKCNHRIYTTLL